MKCPRCGKAVERLPYGGWGCLHCGYKMEAADLLKKGIKIIENASKDMNEAIYKVRYGHLHYQSDDGPFDCPNCGSEMTREQKYCSECGWENAEEKG